MDPRYDLCVIGAGTAGFTAAETARAEGHRVVVVTGPGDLGGTCILRGCMPAKTLLSSTERLGDVTTAGELGVELERAHVDVPAVLKRKRELVDYFAEDRIAELETYPLLRGRARFVAEDAIEVDGKRIVAERFVVATGSYVDASSVPCLPAGEYLTSDDALEMSTIPNSVVVLGGGPVGCEFAQFFARLGADVTLLQDEDELLRNEDADVGAAVRAALQHDGIDVRCGAHVTSCARERSERRITYSQDGTTVDVRAGAVMLASGRVPNVASLDLATAGIARNERGGIAIDAFLQTTNPRVFAAGDVLGRRCLVHVAAYAGKLAAHNAFAKLPLPADFDRYEAHAVYTQPQVAVAGLTERACLEQDIDVRVRRHPFRDVGMALVSDQAAGFIKMLVDANDGIRGITLVGDDAVDLAGEAIALVDLGATTVEVTAMPHLHPTMSEIFARVAEDFTG